MEVGMRREVKNLFGYDMDTRGNLQMVLNLQVGHGDISVAAKGAISSR